MKGEEPRQASAMTSIPAVPAASGDEAAAAPSGRSTDGLFLLGLSTLLGSYIVLIVGLLCALGTFTTFSHILAAIKTEEIRFALRLSLISCTMSTLLSLWVAIPGGYVLSRCKFPGRSLVDAVIDIPIILPPLVMGLALLILFQTPLGAPWSGLCPSRSPRPASCWRSSLWPVRSPCEQCASHSIRSVLRGTSGVDPRLSPQPGFLDGCRCRKPVAAC